MNKQFLIAWLVVFIVYMAGGFVVHGTLLQADYMALPDLFRSEEQSMPYFHLMIIAHVLMAGAFIARRFVLKMEPERFRLLMDGLMLASGATLLGAALLVG